MTGWGSVQKTKSNKCSFLNELGWESMDLSTGEI